MARPSMYLIDGHSLCFRAFYAVRELTTSKGQPTNAVFGVVSTLNRLLSTTHPDYMAVAFDLEGPTFRHERYERYKESRDETPEELLSQFPLIRQLFEAYRIPIFEKQGFEADDVLATLACWAADHETDVYIVTGDKDALQLVNDHIKVYNIQKDGLVVDAAYVRERYGVSPEQMVDLMALTGDSVDDIPGVPGIGPKTASSLLQEFESLDNLLTHRDQVARPSVRQRLYEYEAQARLSQELARVDTRVPLGTLSLERLRVGDPDVDALTELFQRLEFRTLLKQLPSRRTASLATSDTELVTTGEAWKECEEAVRRAGAAHVAPQLSGDSVPDWRVRGCAMSCGDRTWFIPLASEDVAGDEAADDVPAVPRAVKTAWIDLLRDTSIAKVGFDLKPLLTALANEGVPAAGPWDDLMVASYLIDPSRASHALDDVAADVIQERLGDPPPDAADGAAWSAWYGRQAGLVARLRRPLLDVLEERELVSLYRDIELPLVGVLSAMERRGVAVDRQVLEDLSDYLSKELAALEKTIYKEAGSEFNIKSPKQLSEVLFVQLKLPVIKKTKTGASTDVEVLERLSEYHELPKLLLRYRELSKLQSTYVDALPALIHQETGRIHASFNQVVAATGRLSSSNPNLQNIPVRTEEGRKIRRAFVPGARAWVLLSADYSQIELRLLAHLSEDASLIRAFQDGDDIHAYTASLVFDVPQEQVDPTMRATAKTVNFGVIYGISPFGLARQLQIEQDVAREFIEAYFERYPGVRAYMTAQIDAAKRQGYVTTLFNRRRYLPELNSRDHSVRQFAERMAINTPVQGTAADLIKLAMVRLQARMDREAVEGRMLIQVHDELVFECPAREVTSLSRMVAEEMTGAISLRVPIEVSLKSGLNWMELEPLLIN